MNDQNEGRKDEPNESDRDAPQVSPQEREWALESPPVRVGAGPIPRDYHPLTESEAPESFQFWPEVGIDFDSADTDRRETLHRKDIEWRALLSTRAGNPPPSADDRGLVVLTDRTLWYMKRASPVERERVRAAFQKNVHSPTFRDIDIRLITIASIRQIVRRATVGVYQYIEITCQQSEDVPCCVKLLISEESERQELFGAITSRLGHAWENSTRKRYFFSAEGFVVGVVMVALCITCLWLISAYLLEIRTLDQLVASFSKTPPGVVLLVLIFGPGAAIYFWYTDSILGVTLITILLLGVIGALVGTVALVLGIVVGALGFVACLSVGVERNIYCSPTCPDSNSAEKVPATDTTKKDPE